MLINYVSGDLFMVQFEELRLSLLEYEEKLGQLREALGLDDMTKEIAELEEQTAQDGFWNDLANSQKVQQRISQLKNKVGAYNSLENEFNDALVLIELSNEEEDLDMFDECKTSVDSFVEKLDAMTLSTLLSGEYDSKNAILTFHEVQAAQRLRTGIRCLSECISTGAKSTASRSA